MKGLLLQDMKMADFISAQPLFFLWLWARTRLADGEFEDDGWRQDRYWRLHG
jgi:hypothetical protein